MAAQLTSLDVCSAKARLQVQVNGAGGQVGSAWDHLVDLLVEALAQPPETVLARLEMTSLRVKAASAATTVALVGARAAAMASAPVESDDISVGRKNSGAGGAVGAAALRAEAALWIGAGNARAPSCQIAVQDVAAEAAYLVWAGVRLAGGGFSLGLSLRALAESLEAATVGETSAPSLSLRSLRFWGRLKAREVDYLIAEGSRGPAVCAGLNSCVYYAATTSSSSEWTKLPDAVPALVVAAGAIRTPLTGFIAASVTSHPPFPGDEAAYMRARIALVNAGAVIEPAAAYADGACGAGYALQSMRGWPGASGVDLACTKCVFMAE